MRAQVKQSAGFASESAIGNARLGGDIYMIAVLGPKGTFCDKSYEEYNKK